MLPHPKTVSVSLNVADLRYVPLTLSVPEGVEAPTVRNGLPGQVLVTWNVPSHPNGELLQYFIQRAQNGDQEYSNICNQSAAVIRACGDTRLRPYTNYSYRIVAVNGAGSTVGPSSSILTPEAG